VRYGGHTSCVALCHDGAAPTLLLDAGTGIREVGATLGGEPFRGSILLGHLHWDHTQGLPFFGAGDNPNASVDLYMPAQGDPVAVLSRMMSVPFFPISPGELNGSWSFNALEPGAHQIEGFEVTALEIPHKGGRTFGYRVSDGHSSLAYLSDHSPISLGPGPDGLGEYHASAMALTKGCDLVIHDSQYTDAELPGRSTWGHSAIGYAVGLAEHANAKRLLLFHHDPSRSDEAIDEIAESYRDSKVRVDAAAEGMVITLPGAADDR
jgi:phosphoribosyl 1,2-cyclic phosphodiesterase